MSRPQEPQAAKLIVGLLFTDFDVRGKVLGELCARFGPVDFMTEPKPFKYTAYYDREMGPEKSRRAAPPRDPC